MSFRSFWATLSGRASREADERFRAVLALPSPLISSSTEEVIAAAERVCAEIEHDARAAMATTPRPAMRSNPDQEDAAAPDH